MVVHVLPLDLPRGAQVFARGLCDALGPEHRTLTLFRFPPALGSDLPLGVPSGWRRRAGFDPRVLRRLRRALRASRPRAVVAHGGESLKYAAFARPAGVPLVYLKIGLTRPRLRGAARLAFLRAQVRRADAVVCVSEEMVDEARDLLGARAELIPNGRDPEVFRPPVARDRETPRLAFVGHLDAAKRPDLFCQVVSAVRERGRPVEARIVGDGPLLEPLRPVAGAAGVELLGRRDDVPALLAASDVLVFTGSEWEGMPGVLIEAGLCGLPAVSTDVPGARAVVDDGATGYVVGVDDREALVERTARLAGDPGLRARMGSAARARCLERFALQASARRWAALLRRLPGGTAAERPVGQPLGVE